MANVQLKGTQYNNVPYIDAPDGASGTSRFWDMYGEYGFLGWNAEHVSQVYSADYNLEDTSFASWTPSTTATEIIASTTAGTFSADLNNYEYYIRWRMDYNPQFVTGATMKAQTIRQVGSQWQTIHRRPYGLARFATLTDYYAYCATISSASVYLIYYNTNGSLTWTTSSSTSIFPTMVAATFSSTSSATPTVTVKTPMIQAKCSTSYLATARAAEIDQEKSTVKVRGDLFRVNKNATMLKQCYIDALKVYNDPL